MSQRSSRDRSRSDGGRANVCRALDDAALVRAVSAGVPDALEEFMTRFRRLLFDEAAGQGIAPADCDDCVSEVLSKIVTLLIAGRIGAPRAPARYVVQSFWNRWRSTREEVERRRDRFDAALVPAPGDGEWVIAGACSEHAWRASRGADADEDEDTISPVLERLVSAFDEGITDEERTILGWLGRHVSQREIADWLGVSYAAATRRIWRLRERLREAAIRYADSLDLAERRELMRFFRRSYGTRELPRRSTPDRLPRVAESTFEETGSSETGESHE